MSIAVHAICDAYRRPLRVGSCISIDYCMHVNFPCDKDRSCDVYRCACHLRCLSQASMWAPASLSIIECMCAVGSIAFFASHCARCVAPLLQASCRKQSSTTSRPAPSIYILCAQRRPGNTHRLFDAESITSRLEMAESR